MRQQWRQKRLATFAAVVLLFGLTATLATAGPAWAPTTGVTVQDEGVTKGTGITTLNFTGAGVTASAAGTTGTVNVPGATGGTQTFPKWINFRDEGGLEGACDATKAAANDAALDSATAKLAVPLSNGESGGTIYLGRGNFCFGHTVNVADKQRILGDARRGTRIQALSTFSDTVPVVSTGGTVKALVVLGDSTSSTSPVFDTKIERLTVDGNGVSGIVPVFSQQGNEGCCGDDLFIRGFADVGVWLAPGSANVTFQHAEVYGAAGAGANGLLRLESWEKNLVSDVTANATAPVTVGSTGLRFHGYQSTLWVAQGLHCEQVEVCARVQPDLTTFADARVVIDGATGHSSVTKVVQFEGPGGTSPGTHGGVRAIYPLGSATSFVDGNPGGKTFTGTVARYDVVKNRPVITGSRAAMDPALVTLLQAEANVGEVNDQTTP